MHLIISFSEVNVINVSEQEKTPHSNYSLSNGPRKPGRAKLRLNDQQLNKLDQINKREKVPLWLTEVSLGSRLLDILPKGAETCWIFDEAICIQD